MRMRQITRHLIVAVLAGCTLLGASACQAQLTYNVSLNTVALNGLGTFFVEFQLTDGSATGGNNNSQVVISNFSLSGGALGAVLPPTLGNVSGSLAPAGTLTLRDGPAASGPVADFAQAFSITGAASLLRFDLLLTGTGVDAPTPDKFSFLLLDSARNPLATNGPTGAEFVSADFVSTAPEPAAYSSIGSPQLAATIGLIPEPGTGVLIAAASLVSLVGCVCHRRRIA